MNSIAKDIVQDIFLMADCIISCNKDADIHVLDETIYSDILYKGSIAIGDGYVNNKIKISDLEKTLGKLYRFTNISDHIYDIIRMLKFRIIFLYNIFFNVIFDYIKLLFNRQTIYDSVYNISHYNLDYNFYRKFLGKYMQYSCAYYNSDDETLDQAQKNKIDKIINKLQITDGMTILDIGSGYGTLINNIVTTYPSCKIIGINLSSEQIGYSINNKISNCVFIEQDYRTLLKSNIKFDRIVSVGMFEHVGKSNYSEFFKVIDHCLKDDGLMLLHTIVSNKKYMISADPWLNKYIFPNGMVPNLIDILESSNHLKCEDVEDFGFCYIKTLKDWLSNIKNENIDDDKLKKKFIYYFNLCIVAFTYGNISLKQIVLSKKYKCVYKRN